MARSPIDVMVAARHPEGRDVIWAAIRQLGTFTALDVEDATRIHPDTVKTYARALERGGYLERVPAPGRDGQGRYARATWRLVRDVGIEAPRVQNDGRPVTQGQANEQMWRTMKILGEFTYLDLAVQAATPECAVAEGAAKSYCKVLARAGYLVHARPPSARAHTLYRFVPSRNTGPRPPMIQRIKAVFDPNLGRVVWPLPEADGGG
jgi:hypothetical protein